MSANWYIMAKNPLTTLIIIAALTVAIGVICVRIFVPHQNLFEAAATDDAVLVRRILSAGADPNLKDSRGFTPLHHAAKRGSLPVVKELVEAGARVDMRDIQGDTPLAVASAKGNTKTVKYLISKRADVNSRDIHGYTPLRFAVQNRCSNAVHELIAAGAVVDLHSAAGLDRCDMIVALIRKGADVNERIKLGGETPLHWALSRRSTELLIHNGADINACDNYGRTPLHNACRIGRTDEISCLVANGANVNARDKYGETPLTAGSSHPNVVSLMQQYGGTK